VRIDPSFAELFVTVRLHSFSTLPKGSRLLQNLFGGDPYGSAFHVRGER